MAKITLRQGEIITLLSEIAYHQPEGFQEQGTWHATEQVITADSDTKLECGPATIQRAGRCYHVTVTVMEFQKQPGEEDDEPEEDEPVCSIEIDYVDGLPKLAYALGLLEGYNKGQLAALGVTATK